MKLEVGKYYRGSDTRLYQAIRVTNLPSAFFILKSFPLGEVRTVACLVDGQRVNIIDVDMVAEVDTNTILFDLDLNLRGEQPLSI